MTHETNTQQQSSLAVTPAVRNGHFRPRPLAAAVAGTLLALAANQALAADCTFNKASGNWNDGANWSCGTLPGSSDTAKVNTGSTVTIPWGGVAGTTTLENAGTVAVDNNGKLYLQGSNQNTGSILLNSDGGANVQLLISGATSINGSGVITISDTIQNQIIAGSGTGDGLTLGANQVLQGAGAIGAGTNLGLVNNGSLIANLSSGMSLATQGSVTNNNVMRGDGAIFSIGDTTVNQGAAGVLDARNGGSVRLYDNTKIIGGSLDSDSSSAVSTAWGARVRLDGVTNQGTLEIVNNSSLILDGKLTNSGTLKLNSDGNGNSRLVINGAREIDGSGVITISDTIQNQIIAGSGTGDGLTLGANQVLQGAGAIGAGTNLGLVNNGSLIANLSSGMSLATQGSVTNNNVMRGDGAIFSIGDTTVNQGAAGVLDARNGGSVALSNGSKIIGGSLDSDSSSAVSTVWGHHDVRLDGVTNQGTLEIVNNSSLILDGKLTNSGTLKLNSGGNGNSRLVINGAREIDGSGVITISDTIQNQIIAGSGTGDGLTLGANQVLQGAGAIGAGTALDLVNRGTITANQSTALTISVNAANSVGNEASGLMQAVGGSTLNLVNVVQNDGTFAANGGNVNASAGFNGSGTARTSGTGVLTIGANSTVGTLINDGSAANALTLGSSNITVSGDYTNANAGSGNSFNRRANVSGSGQILASGDVKQVITGANVTGGDTANATLTIGNVRVGGTTFDYQIGNAGTTGPTLRGAIQTSVNGGNLTDARLSGVGVTAGNYNAGGPGGNSGNLGVTFTAASAGALAPLSGQVLNLKSNFDNIADQKLNIVLASGAAAYNAATGSASPSPTVNLGNTRVGGTLAQSFTVTNTAPTGAYTEDLNAGFTATSGAASHNNGSISGLLAGDHNNSAMSASLDTASAGAKTGSVTIGYQTAGAVGGVSNGLAVDSAGSETITLNGAVYNMAAGSATPGPVSIANQRVGGSNTVALTVSNTAAAGNYSEDLRATFGSNSGAATNNGGTISALLAGSSPDGSTMHVGVDTTSAGAKSGTVTLNYQTTGTVNGVSNGLGVADVGNQVINVSGNVYRLAEANTIDDIAFGNVLKGSTQTRTLSISNLAAADGFSEALNAAFGTIGGANADRFGTSGSITGLLAGSSDNTSMVVTLNTSNTGSVSATVQVLLDSNGDAIGNGLGLKALDTQVINLSGVITAQVGDLATAGMSPTSINFGKFREGQASSRSQALTISNLTTGPGEGLNASFGASTGDASHNNGSISGLATGATNDSDMTVTLNGLDTAGAKSGTVSVNFASDGSFNNGQVTPLDPQNVTMNAEVYRLANPSLNTSSVTIAARVGDAVAADKDVSISNSSPDIYTEGLKVAVAGTSGNAQGSGSIANLAAQATDNGSIKVGLASTASAGNSMGQVTLDMTSTGTGTTGAADVSLGTAIVDVVGKVYQKAVATVQSVIDFGIVHVGDALGVRTVEVRNTALVADLNDSLTGSLGGASGPFTASGSLAGVQAGQKDDSSLTVSLNTSVAGVYAGSATLALASHNPDMADLALPSAVVLLDAQVNNYAKAALNKTGGNGSFSQSGLVYTLDFGDLILGSSVNASLEVLNAASDLADLLDGLFNLDHGDDFNYLGFSEFSNLGAGVSHGGLKVAFNASTVGLFTDDILLSSWGWNASGYSGNLADITLRIRGKVVEGGGGSVPEPGTLGMMLLGLALAATARRQRAVMRSAA